MRYWLQPGDSVVIQIPLGITSNKETAVVDLRGAKACFPLVYGDKDGSPIFTTLEVDWERLILGVYLPWEEDLNVSTRSKTR